MYRHKPVTRNVNDENLTPPPPPPPFTGARRIESGVDRSAQGVSMRRLAGFPAALLAATFTLLAAQPVQATAPPSLTVSSGATLTVTWSAPTYTIVGGSVRWRLQDEIPDDILAGNQPGDWLPKDSGAVFTAAQRTARSVPIPPWNCVGCNSVANETYEVQISFNRVGDGETGWLDAGTGTPTTSTIATSANLANLRVTSSTDGSAFTPLSIGTFSSATTAYTASVAHSVTHVKLTSDREHVNASIRVGKSGSLTAVDSGVPSANIALSEGANAILVEVTAQDSTKKTYTVTITRASATTTTPTVTLSATPTTVAEGSSVTVTASLSAAAQSNLDIPVTLTAVTAENGDYDGTLTNIRIDSGATSGTATITTAQDDDTDDETFTVALGTLPSSVTAGSTTSVLITIDDDDTPTTPATPGLPTVSLSATPNNPVQEGSSLTVTATLSGGTLTYDLTIPITLTSDPTAGGAETADYGALTSMTIAAGSTSQTATITIADDTDDKDNETFTISLGTLPAGVQADSRRSSVVVTIDDDDPLALTLLADSLRVSPGSTVEVTAMLDERPPSDATVTIDVSAASTAERPGDYTSDPPLATDLTIPTTATGSSSAVTIEVKPDATAGNNHRPHGGCHLRWGGSLCE